MLGKYGDPKGASNMTLQSLGNPLRCDHALNFHEVRRKHRLQRVADLTAGLVTAAGRGAALPLGGMKTGTTNAERIIKTASPTKTSTRVMCHFLFELFIAAFLSLQVTATPTPNWGMHYSLRPSTTR